MVVSLEQAHTRLNRLVQQSLTHLCEMGAASPVLDKSIVHPRGGEVYNQFMYLVHVASSAQPITSARRMIFCAVGVTE